MKKISLAWVIAAMLAACGGIPKGVTPVTDFDIGRYQGVWYEIARLEHSFESGLSDVTASYGSRDDGGIDVVNRGCDVEKGKWRVAKGRAYPATTADIGYLKVSFFGPFYASYVVFDLDKAAYQYSFVTGPDRNYLWLLARTPHVQEEVLKKFIRESNKLGFNTEKLIFVKHHSAPCHAAG
nr:lipocalin family protein [Nitrosospira multiformis]